MVYQQFYYYFTNSGVSEVTLKFMCQIDPQQTTPKQKQAGNMCIAIGLYNIRT